MDITEDYVSYEVAKLLKEKGFNWDCITYYVDSEPNCVKYSMLFENNTTWEERCCSAPTHQMAMKWLREVHQLYISVGVSPIYGKVKDEKGRNTCGLLYWHYMASGEWMNDKYNPQQKAFVVSAKNYEEAVEAALKYSLENLI